MFIFKISGNSAGGYGVFGNYNWFYSHMKSNAVNKDIIIKAAPMSGWFFPGNDTIDQPDDPLAPPNDYPHWVANQTGGEGHDPSINELWDTYLIPECVEALGNESWHCSSVHNIYPFLKGPIFVMENKYDTNQIHAQFLMPENPVTPQTIGYVEYFGLDMENSIFTRIIDINNATNGVYFASCFDHGGGLGIGLSSGASTINGYNSSELVGDWFWERNKLPHFVYDTCNDQKNLLPCNPTCDTYPPKK